MVILLALSLKKTGELPTANPPQTSKTLGFKNQKKYIYIL